VSEPCGIAVQQWLGEATHLPTVWATNGPRITLVGVSAEQVALIPRCAECCEVWLPDDEERIIAGLTSLGGKLDA
jgi:hypothetical protein